MSIAKTEVPAVITRATDFWVVTKPTDDEVHEEFPWTESKTVLEDICFSTDLLGLMRQFRGGLEAQEIVGIWLDREPAEQVAQHLLEGR